MMLLPGSFYAAASSLTFGQAYLYYGAPRYVTAFIVNIAATGLAIGFATVTRIWLRKIN
ncbi:TNA1 is necessary for nicotinic acid import into the cell [Colletotrichum cuscutae]|uniref:TNA1 is necessary for nicotinic acid import into the cell n=1 Tax=Colletotrichum cuscutae TaxID=1209917 RepID=A0AAI9Y773_9PEZI|nr:TNA1 is necessary for nicotinic acid import into the cell [Colletotrichum cuscutae]